MSHFTVLVIGDNPEEKLAPYQENNMGDCPEQYLEFIDETEYVEDLVERPLSGSYYKDNYPEWVGKTHGEFYLHKLQNDEEAQEGFEKNNGIKVEDASELDAVAFLNCGFTARRNENGNIHYGYGANPNSKWDWYQLGGRWKGNFLPKEEASGNSGSPGIFGNQGREGWVDQIRKGDVDWDKMREIKKQELHDQYDKYEAKLASNDVLTEEQVNTYLDWWDKNEYPNKNINRTPQDDHDSVDEFIQARRQYICARDTGIISILETENDVLSREEYVDQYKVFSSYAVIDHSGEWYEPGEMGWFGCSSANNDEVREFKRSVFETWIKPLPDNTLLSVYDCHI